jgi:hypothetical protein
MKDLVNQSAENFAEAGRLWDEGGNAQRPASPAHTQPDDLRPQRDASKPGHDAVELAAATCQAIADGADGRLDETFTSLTLTARSADVTLRSLAK